MAMQCECEPEQFTAAVKKQLEERSDEFLKKLPSFKEEYQRWYSEALGCYANFSQIVGPTSPDTMRSQGHPRTSLSRTIGLKNSCSFDQVVHLCHDGVLYFEIIGEL
jgi:hypothetical protein